MNSPPLNQNRSNRSRSASASHTAQWPGVVYRLGGARALAGWRDWLGWWRSHCSGLSWPQPVEPQEYPHQGDQHKLGEKQVWNHSNAPSSRVEMGVLYRVLTPQGLSARYGYTTGRDPRDGRAAGDRSSAQTDCGPRCHAPATHDVLLEKLCERWGLHFLWAEPACRLPAFGPL